MRVKGEEISVEDMFGVNKKSGDIGLEIEAEAKGPVHFPVEGLPPGWNATADNSLRGISIEYVLGQPIKISNVGKKIDELVKCLHNYGTEVKYSFRAGVHVHVNCQDLNMRQVLLFAALYYSVENVLIDWCGSDRVGNLFCLRARDAEGVIHMVGNAFAGNSGYGTLGSNHLRYASMNFAALAKYGSLEFRAMPTYPGFEGIEKWAQMLFQLKEKSKEIDSIETLLERFSMASPREWLQEVLGDFYDEVKDQDNIDQKVWEGVYYAQDLLFYIT